MLHPLELKVLETEERLALSYVQCVQIIHDYYTDFVVKTYCGCASDESNFSCFVRSNRWRKRMNKISSSTAQLQRSPMPTFIKYLHSQREYRQNVYFENHRFGFLWKLVAQILMEWFATSMKFSPFEVLNSCSVDYFAREKLQHQTNCQTFITHS